MEEHGVIKAIRNRVAFLYGHDLAPTVYSRLMHMLDDFKTHHSARVVEDEPLTERDSMLITYGDMISEPDSPPLAILHDFLTAHLKGIVSTVHLLPFFPYSSDDGFSVIDYHKVDPKLGTWDDIWRLRQHFRLMFDGVINHISAQSSWFKDFLRDDPVHKDWFIVVEGNPDMSQVVRPRTLPLLTDFSTPSGPKAIWTTFSGDQIDLNYQNPDVLLMMIGTLLFYVSQGTEFIRLDAVAYLWKEIGTSCIHLPQTHCIIQLMRAVLNEVAPHVKLITETNVPHLENISYWGDGYNEAQLVYNFALPPLILHSIRTGSSRAISEWANTLSLPSNHVTFFNFLASHDGIGLNPVRGILTAAEIDAMVDQTVAHGGHVSYKRNQNGSQDPYELNINYFDALSDPMGNEPLPVQIDRFMVAQAILLALMGLPGIYFHSLFGSRGWLEGAQVTGHNRSINRQKLSRVKLDHELSDTGSLRYQVFNRYGHLLKARASSPAFHPYGAQQVRECGESIFAVLRSSPVGEERVLCLHNVSDKPQIVDLSDIGPSLADLLSQQRWQNALSIELTPYQVRWLHLEGHHGSHT